jgi:hypothetical protein
MTHIFLLVYQTSSKTAGYTATGNQPVFAETERPTTLDIASWRGEVEAEHENDSVVLILNIIPLDAGN